MNRSVFVFFVFLVNLCFAQYTQVNLFRKYPVVMEKDNIWIGVNDGLYQYSRQSENIIRYNTSDLASISVQQIIASDGWLWIAGNKGITAINPAINERLFFNSEKGLPSEIITGIDAGEDYIWIATPEGLARFDKLTEQWEAINEKRGLPQKDIKDVICSENSVYALASENLYEYDQKFEKWRAYSLNGKIRNYYRMFRIADDIWFAGEQGLTRFNKKLNVLQSYDNEFLQKENLIEIYTESEKLWAATKKGIFYFNNISGSWLEFEDNNYFAGDKPEFVFMSSSKLIITCPGKVLLRDNASKSWTNLNYSSGLSGEKYESAYTNGETVILLSEKILDFQRNQVSQWRSYKPEQSSGNTAGNILKDFFDNEGKSNLDVFGQKIYFTGTKIGHYRTLTNRYNDNGEIQQTELNTTRSDIKISIPFSKERSISAIYNDIESKEKNYGIKYRGNNADIVKEVSLGDFDYDYSRNSFIGNSKIYGTDIWLQYGEKTEKYKRPLLTVRSSNGEIRSLKYYEVFYNPVKADSFAENSLIVLKKSNLVKGSESVKVDGLKAAGGNDYILDYTNGTLLFIKEGLLNKNTRIEIEYSYYKNEQTVNQYSGLINYSPSDNFVFQSDYVLTDDNSVGFGAFSVDIRKNLAGVDIRIIPEITLQLKEKSFGAEGVKLFISSDKLRIQSSFQNFSRSYKNLNEPLFIYGRIKNRVEGDAEWDMMSFLRINGNFYNINADMNNNFDKGIQASALLHQEKLPAVSLGYFTGKSLSADTTIERNSVFGSAEYQVPESVLSNTGIRKARVEGYLKYSRESDYFNNAFQQQTFINSYYKLNTTIFKKTEAGFFYRSNSFYDNSVSEIFRSSSERMLADVSLSDLSFCHVNLRVDNLLRQSGVKNGNIRKYNLTRLDQANIRLFAGEILKTLEKFYFEFNYTGEKYLSGETSGDAFRKLFSFETENAVGNTKNFSFKNEYRPFADHIFTTLYEWGNYNNSLTLGSDISYKRLSEKVDIKAGYNTHLISQFRYYSGEASDYYEPSLWIEQRISKAFLMTLNGYYNKKKIKNSVSDYSVQEFGGSADFIFQLNKVFGIKYIELRQSASVTRRKGNGISPDNNLFFTIGSSADINPVTSLMLRMKLDYSKYRSYSDAALGYYDLNFNIITTLTF